MKKQHKAKSNKDLLYLARLGEVEAQYEYSSLFERHDVPVINYSGDYIKPNDEKTVF